MSISNITHQNTQITLNPIINSVNNNKVDHTTKIAQEALGSAKISSCYKITKANLQSIELNAKLPIELKNTDVLDLIKVINTRMTDFKYTFERLYTSKLTSDDEMTSFFIRLNKQYNIYKNLANKAQLDFNHLNEIIQSQSKSKGSIDLYCNVQIRVLEEYKNYLHQVCQHSYEILVAVGSNDLNLVSELFSKF